MRSGGVPAWYYLGGFGGAALVLVSAVAAPEVGVALLTVALVCGSTGGSLPVDAAGLGPGGRRPITPPRVAGVLLAIIATVISAHGARGDPNVLLLALALAAGLGMSLQAAANGQLARATGEPWAASLVNVAVGLAALGVVALVTLATSSLDGMPGNPLLYAGGLLGAFVVVVGATAVQTLGVVRLGLAMVAGQTTGALVVDLIAPVRGEPVTAATVIGVVLTMVAVAVSGRGQRRGHAKPSRSVPRPPVRLEPMPSARAQRQSVVRPSWSSRAWSAATTGAAGSRGRLIVEPLASRAAADELAEARELLAYWEQRARRLPRWALMRRREARAMARRWRERVRTAEQVRYGHGLLGAASQLAVERRMPTTVAHRGRQALRLAAYTAAFAVLTLVLVFAAAVAVVAEAVLGAL